MKKPYLIQRLLKPFAKNDNPMMEAISSAFSFGAGLKNGGLSDEAMKLIREIWRYDYMGSFEFEWGAVPKSLQHIAQNISKYVIGEIEVTGKYKDWYKEKEFNVKAPVYYVCKKDDITEVCLWINKFADEIGKRDYHTKESVNLAGAICGVEFYKENAGWHDIGNHYLFFTEERMFSAFISLMGIQKENQPIK